ncbi:MAG TPA: hypothetical protein VGF69_05500 [Thermoanaerobaculia bacterium]
MFIFFNVVGVFAATLKPVTDAELLGRSEAVVVATVGDSVSRLRGDRSIVTDHTLVVEQVVKGRLDGSTLTVTELGGFANGKGMLVPGTPAYAKGERVVAFLNRRADGSWFTAGMALGKFRFATALDGTSVVVRDGENVEVADPSAFEARPAAAFVDYLRGGATGNQPQAVASKKFVPKTEAAPAAYVLSGGVPAKPIRWDGCESNCNIGFVVNGAQPGADVNAGISAAMAAWVNDPNSFVGMSNNGSTAVTEAANDGVSAILLNSNTDTQGFCDGALGCGIVYFGSTHTYQGVSFYSVESADVVVRPGNFGQTGFEAIVAHELGHALAFRHSDGGTPFSTDALMNSIVNTNSGAQLRSWDGEAMAIVYGNGLPCQPATILSTSGGGTVPANATSTLQVFPGGTDPFTYQWYRGSTGDFSQPVGTNAATFQTPPIAEPMTFWVKVTNACGNASSNTITVQPQECFPVVINGQPQSQRITPNNRANLSVIVGGSQPYIFQWFEGPVGTTTKPVGTSSPTFQTPVLTQTTAYWVRVKNDCGEVNSQAAVITVGTNCVPPTIVTQPTGANTSTGKKVTLSVVAAGDGPITYQWYRGEPNDVSTPLPNSNSASVEIGPLDIAGTFKFWVRVTNQCGQISSTAATLTIVCLDAPKPILSAPPIVPSSHDYELSWTGSLDVTQRFELQEARTPDFANASTLPILSALKRKLSAHTELIADARFYYRIRAFSPCNNQPGEWSDPVSTVITRPQPANSSEFSMSIGADATQTLRQDILIPGFGATATTADRFAVTTDQPWLTVFPASGALSAGGTTVQMTVNPALLGIGTTTATITIARTQGSGKVGVNADPPPSSVPVSVSRVTPVTAQPRSATPPPGTLIIPALAHADGFNSRFQSDVRITNTFTSAMTYELSYTPTQTNGTQAGKRTVMTIDANETKGLNDVVKAWYGSGLLGEFGVGTLEIRPISVASTPGGGGGTPAIPLTTVASSRTYNVTPNGTLGQYIPALALSSFIGKLADNSLAKISLQQVAQSTAFRTNLGFVEGAGSGADLIVKLYNGSNVEIGSKTLSLSAYEHRQISFPEVFPGVQVADGRVEVQVAGGDGRVTAYASVLDNKTSDPLLVFPVQAAKVAAKRFVVPGVAELNNGAANFHTDMRIFNGSAAPVALTVNYFPQSGEAPAPLQMTLQAGEVKVVDDVLPSLFSLTNSGGAVSVTTPNDASVVVTARTYSRDTNGGTFGQFIPAVSAQDAVGLGDRNLEVLQLEESSLFRSNLGLVEVTGNDVLLEISGYPQGSRVAAVTQLLLKGNEFRQVNRVMASLGFPTTYNGRVSVKVLAGEGRVASYGSVVDNRTQDPTYVPAQ